MHSNNYIPQPAETIIARGIHPIPIESEGFTFNHTMLRIKDPVRSLEFYSKILGMSLVLTRQFPEMGFDLYFLSKLTSEERENLPSSNEELTIFAVRQRGMLELVHNYGTEDEKDFSYHNGNSEPRGFGHICFSVPNFDDAIAWFDKNNVNFVKRPEDGTMKYIAFIQDPDGYWIEIAQPELMV